MTTTTTKAAKFDARFYHLIYEEEIGRVKGHFGPIKSMKFHPDGTRWDSIRTYVPELMVVVRSWCYEYYIFSNVVLWI